MGERGFQGHPGSVHHELVHVPLWIKYPQEDPAQSGTQIDSLVSGVDLMPTVLDVAGIAAPAGLSGTSLYRSTLEPHRLLVAESFVYSSLSKIQGRHDAGQRALYRDSWKFIATTTGEKQLYDWRADPTELHDVYAAHPDVVDRLNRELELWLSLAPRRNARSPQSSPETLERLKGLGYIN